MNQNGAWGINQARITIFSIFGKTPGTFLFDGRRRKVKLEGLAPNWNCRKSAAPQFHFSTATIKKKCPPWKSQKWHFWTIVRANAIWAPIKKTAGATRAEPPIRRGNRSWGPNDPNENSRFTCLPPKFDFFLTLACGAIQIRQNFPKYGTKKCAEFHQKSMTSATFRTLDYAGSIALAILRRLVKFQHPIPLIEKVMNILSWAPK